MNHQDWDTIVKDLAPALYRYFNANFHRELSEDLVQETLLRLLQKLESRQYDKNKGSLRMFAFGIAFYVRLEARRMSISTSLPRELSDHHGPGQNSEQRPDLIMEQRQDVLNLRRALEELPEVGREIILLYLDKQLTMDEIGRILGLPVGTVKSHLFRCKKILQERLNQKQEKSE